jgi:hypothetical protein
VHFYRDADSSREKENLRRRRVENGTSVERVIYKNKLHVTSFVLNDEGGVDSGRSAVTDGVA